MKQKPAIRLLSGLALYACLSCGLPPSSTVVGDWQGRMAPAHFDYVYFHLDQVGSAISGTACMYLGPVRAPNRAPVLVDYPAVSIVFAPESPGVCCGWRFDGTFQKDGTLKGQHKYTSSLSDPYEMSFVRTDSVCPPVAGANP